MRILKKIGMTVYMILMLAAGSLVFFISLDIIPSERCAEALNILHESMGWQIVLWAASAVFITNGIIAPLRVIRSMRRDRLIRFRNPDGEVSVSISAIEDYIRRIAKAIPNITNVRSRVSFGRKGINIVSDVTMASGSNIPEITEKIQMEVRNKVQAMLGVEEKITMTMYIRKIMGDVPEKEEQRHEEPEPARVPFR